MASVKPFKLNSMVGAKWGEKGTLQIPVGPTYQELVIETNASADDLERVSITLNAEEIYVLTGAELVMLESYKRREQTDGLFVIPFGDITARTQMGVRYSALVTELGDAIQLDIQFKAKAANAPLLSIQVWAHTTEQQLARIMIPRIRRQTMSANAMGDNEFTNLVSARNLAIRRMHFMHGAISKLKIERDFQKEFEASKKVVNANAIRNERTPQAGYFHFDPIVRGFSIDDLFSTTHNSQLNFTVTTDDVAGSIPILIESIEIVRPDLLAAPTATK